MQLFRKSDFGEALWCEVSGNQHGLRLDPCVLILIRVSSARRFYRNYEPELRSLPVPSVLFNIVRIYITSGRRFVHRHESQVASALSASQDFGVERISLLICFAEPKFVRGHGVSS